MDNKEIAKKLGAVGGNITKERYGSEHYREIAKKSHQKRRENKRMRKPLFI